MVEREKERDEFFFFFHYSSTKKSNLAVDSIIRLNQPLDGQQREKHTLMDTHTTDVRLHMHFLEHLIATRASCAKKEYQDDTTYRQS